MLLFKFDHMVEEVHNFISSLYRANRYKFPVHPPVRGCRQWKSIHCMGRRVCTMCVHTVCVLIYVRTCMWVRACVCVRSTHTYRFCLFIKNRSVIRETINFVHHVIFVKISGNSFEKNTIKKHLRTLGEHLPWILW